MIGFYGQRNVGDDAMLYSLLKVFSDKDSFILIVPTDFLTDFPCIKSKIKVVARNMRSVFFELLRCDAVLVGGGSLLHTKGGKNKFNIMVFRFLLLTLIARFLAKKIWFFGVGVGPFENKIGNIMMKLIFSFGTYFALRDYDSVGYAERWNVDKKKYNKAPELALNYCLPPNNVFCEVSSKLGLSLIPHFREYGSSSTKADFMKAVKQLSLNLRQRNREIVFYSFFDGRDKSYSDNYLIDELKNTCFGKTIKLETFNYTPYPRDFLQSMNNLSGFISMRYHGVVFCYLLGLPCAAIAVHEKISSFVKEVNVPWIKEFPGDKINFDQVLDFISLQDRNRIVRPNIDSSDNFYKELLKQLI